VRYIHGSLSALESQKVEQHVSKCKHCNAKLNRLLEGDALAKLIPPIPSKEDGWEKLQAAIANEKASKSTKSTSTLLRAGVAILIVSFAGFILWYLAEISSNPLSGFSADEYRKVSISEMPKNTEPHIVTEGYISEVRVDHLEGDLVFKLVESLEEPSPFVICEIIPPFRLNTPQVGEKVRVYGVSRFDPKENHQWYEVHPVMSIEVVD
jgi:hypothetical protein